MARHPGSSAVPAAVLPHVCLIWGPLSSVLGALAPSRPEWQPSTWQPQTSPLPTTVGHQWSFPECPLPLSLLQRHREAGSLPRPPTAPPPLTHPCGAGNSVPCV